MDEFIERRAVDLLRSGAVNNWTFARLKAEDAFTRRAIVCLALVEARDGNLRPAYWFGKKKFNRACANIVRRIRSGNLID